MLAKELFAKFGACSEAREWVGERTIDRAFNECPRGDWMLWLFEETTQDDLVNLTLAKGHCANTVRHLMKDERSIAAVDAAIAFGCGIITKKELDAYGASAASASFAYASFAYTSAASYAAYASYAASAAYASASSAASAAASAVYASYASTRKENQQETADICRKYLPLSIWNLS